MKFQGYIILCIHSHLKLISCLFSVMQTRSHHIDHIYVYVFVDDGMFM